MHFYSEKEANLLHFYPVFTLRSSGQLYGSDEYLNKNCAPFIHKLFYIYVMEYLYL